MQNLALIATIPPQMISPPPCRNLIEKTGPSSSSISLFGVPVNLTSLLTPPPLNYTYEDTDSDGDSLSSQNNEPAASPTCVPSGPLSTPTIPTQKLNFFCVTLTLPEAVYIKDVAILVDVACTARPNSGPDIGSYCANADRCENGFRTGGVSTGSALEDN